MRKSPSTKRTVVARFAEKVSPEPNTGCWLWTARCDDKGYGRLKVHNRPCAAHRVSWEIHRGPVPLGRFVLHRCDTPTCVNPGHLFLGTHRENMRDMVAKGRSSSANRRGEGNPGAKLTKERVAELRAARAAGLSHRKLAARFEISTGQVHNVLTGKCWVPNV